MADSDQAAETPIADLASRLVALLAEGWRYQLDAPDKLSSAVGPGEKIGKYLQSREALIAELVEGLEEASAELGDIETAIDRGDDWLAGKVCRSLSDDIRAIIAKAKDAGNA